MEKLGLVIFGASQYDNWPALNNSRFANSAKAFGDLISSKDCVGDREVSVLDLYDQALEPGQTTERIKQFIKGSNFDDLVIFYCGHGDLSLDRSDYSLCLRTTSQDNPATRLRVPDFASALQDSFFGKRVFVVLDACYAGAALATFLDASPVSHIERQLIESFPRKGVAVLAATEGRDIALAKTEDQFTFFTGGLIATLRSGIGTKNVEERVSWREVFEHTSAALIERLGIAAPRPRLLQTRPGDGDITAIPFFRNHSYRTGGDSVAIGDMDALDALSPDAFANKLALHCVVVTAELQGIQTLNRHVRHALENYSDEIEAAAASLGATRYETADKRSSEVVQSTIDVVKAFASSGTLKAAIFALCRADIVVFDITKLQPGIMFLLGVRSVARRGITICSYGDDYIHGHGLPLPFNLQMLNVGAHSSGQAKIANARPMDIIGRKIVSGLKEFVSKPGYMDLPAYEHVRGNTRNAEDLSPIPRSKKVLVLCPFSPQYEERNWGPVVFPELSGKLKLQKVPHAASANSAGLAMPPSGPVLVRLLDIETPRLVVQTLYELIRRVDMCVVDWTGLRPNVMYELGVRLAANRMGAVHISDASADSAALTENLAVLKHVEGLKKLFTIHSYRSENTDPKHFRTMVEWFDGGYRRGTTAAEIALYRNDRLMDFLVYETIGEADTPNESGESVSVLEDLVAQARQYEGDDQESTGTSSAIYHDVNPRLRARSEAAATERRVAAWLYLDARYTDQEIERDAELAHQFKSLSAKIRLSFAKRQDQNGSSILDAHDNRILARIEQRSSIAGPRQDDLSSLDAIVTLKDEAKVLRDSRDIQGAIDKLHSAIDLIQRSNWDTLQKSVQKKFAWHLADCFGMLGGNHRRTGNIDQAIVHFQKGSTYEKDARYGVSSSYNTVNAIVAAVEAGLRSASSQSAELKQAVTLLERQILEPEVSGESRRTDRWAWADLAQCKLLLNDLAGAEPAYDQFVELADKSSIRSSQKALEALLAALRLKNDPVARTVSAGVDLLTRAATRIPP